MPAGPQDLQDGGFGRVVSAQGVQSVGADGLQADPGPGQLVPQQRIGSRRRAPGHGQQVLELTPEADLQAEHGRAALQRQGGLGHPPTVTRLADHVGGVGARAVEEHLVELRDPGELPDRADRDPGLPHRDQQVGQAVAARRAGLGPSQHETPVGHVGQGRPDLLAGDHPVLAVEDGLGGHVGQVGAGAGFGVTLAPQLGDGADRRQETLLLLRGAEGDQGGAQQFLAHDGDPGGCVGPGVLLVEDDLPGQVGAVAAELGGPAQAGPARGGQVPVPGQPLVETLVLAAGAPRAAQAGEGAGQVGVEPRAHLGAELLVLRREPHPGLPWG